MQKLCILQATMTHMPLSNSACGAEHGALCITNILNIAVMLLKVHTLLLHQIILQVIADLDLVHAQEPSSSELPAMIAGKRNLSFHFFHKTFLTACNLSNCTL